MPDPEYPRANRDEERYREIEEEQHNLDGDEEDDSSLERGVAPEEISGEISVDELMGGPGPKGQKRAEKKKK